MPRVLLALALALVLTTPAHAASPFAPLERAAKAAKLDAKTRAALTRARRAHTRGDRCRTLRELGTVVTRAKRRAKGVTTAARARTLQRKLFKSRCLPKPRVRVSTEVDPSRPTAGGRPVAAMDDGDGTATDFIADELVVHAKNEAALKPFLARWGGTVLERVAGSYFRVRVKTARGKPGGLAADLRAMDPRAHGSLMVSSPAALRLLAIAADAAAHGLKVAPNFVASGTSIATGSTLEGEKSTGEFWTRDAFGLWYNRSHYDKGLGAGPAWTHMVKAGKQNTRVKVAVIDNGFSADISDLAPGATGGDGVGSPGKRCGNGTIECPWHGTNVASTMAAVPDNGLGVAGSGGLVSDVMMLPGGETQFDMIDSIYDAFNAGVKVINISMSYELDALVSEFNVPIEDATQEARNKGAMVFAAAGNEGRDVDAEDCVIVCWEEEWIAPCENDGVTCVGGITIDKVRAPNSNYGFEWCGKAIDCDVDLWAPMAVWVGPDPEEPTSHVVGGTSVASPFAAGVAALVRAARPSLSPSAVEEHLRSYGMKSTDANVSRIVFPSLAVEKALEGQTLGVFVELLSPAAGTKVPYGGFNTTPFTAKATTLDSDPTCCHYVWSSDVDGPLGTGPVIDAHFGSAGPRTVTVTANDAQGNWAKASIQVVGVNSPPSVKIVFPTSGADLYRGQPYKFEGSATDPQEPGGVPCERYRWSTRVYNGGQPSQSLGTGCQPAATFSTNGSYEVSLSVDDADGAGATVSHIVHVVDPPVNAPPSVEILKPDSGAFLYPNQTYTLEASAIDPDTGDPVVGSWSVRQDGTTKAIGSGNTRQWRPGDHVTGNCSNVSATLIFSATDLNGTSTDEIPISVAYGPC